MFTIPAPNRHWGCRINDQITWHGLRALIIQNELLQIVVLVDKGSEIIQFLYKPLDVDFLWRAPNQVQSPDRFVRAAGSSSTPFFDHWDGGWFEVIPNGEPTSEYKGAPLGFYAETINIAWSYTILDDRPERVSVALWVRLGRLPLLVQKTLTLESGKAALQIEERITNEGNETIEFMWGHHPVVGAPFLDESCQIAAPDCKVEIFGPEDGPDHRMGLYQIDNWPFIKDRDGNLLDLRNLPPRSDRTMDNCYLYGFDQGWIAVTNANRQIGFGLAWDHQVFRYIWLWQALGGGLGYPWFGRTYNMGIEPWSSYPCSGLQESIKNGTALSLEAGSSLDAWVTTVAYTGIEKVSSITRDGKVVFTSGQLANQPPSPDL
jgi:hypothetical protein